MHRNRVQKLSTYSRIWIVGMEESPGHLNPVPWSSWFDGAGLSMGDRGCVRGSPWDLYRVWCGERLTEVSPSHRGRPPPPRPRPVEPGTPGNPARPQGAVCLGRRAGPSELHREPELPTESLLLFFELFWTGLALLRSAAARPVEYLKMAALFPAASFLPNWKSQELSLSWSPSLGHWFPSVCDQKECSRCGLPAEPEDSCELQGPWGRLWKAGGWRGPGWPAPRCRRTPTTPGVVRGQRLFSCRPADRGALWGLGQKPHLMVRWRFAFLDCQLIFPSMRLSSGGRMG